MTCTASGKKKKLSRQVILCAKAKNGENILCFCAHTRCILTKRVFLLFLCFELFKSISRLRRRWVRRRRRQEERSDRRLPDPGFLERNPVRRPACACDKSCRGGGGGDSFSRAAPGILACGACGGSRSSRDGGAGSSSPPSPPPAYYSEPDFYIGAPLRLHGRGFLLLAAEERALRRMETAGHPLARRWEAAAAARAALEAAAGVASSSAGSAVAFGGSELLREALAAVALQKWEREEEKEGGDGPSPGRRGASPPPAIAPPPLPSPLLLLTPDELGEAFAAAGAPLDGPAQVELPWPALSGEARGPGTRSTPRRWSRGSLGEKREREKEEELVDQLEQVRIVEELA